MVLMKAQSRVTNSAWVRAQEKVTFEKALNTFLKDR